MRAFLKLTLLIVSVSFLSSCDSNGSDDSDNVNADGKYSLSSVANQPLPVTVLQLGDDKLEITGGSIELRTDKSFRAELSIRTTESGTVTNDTEADEGTYSVTGSSIRLVYGDESVDTGTLSNGVLTVNSDGLSLVFRK